MCQSAFDSKVQDWQDGLWMLVRTRSPRQSLYASNSAKEAMT